MNDSGSAPVIAPAAISVPIELEADMETKFGHIFVQRKVSENGESFVLRSGVPAAFRYRSTDMMLKAGEEVVLYF